MINKLDNLINKAEQMLEHFDGKNAESKINFENLLKEFRTFSHRLNNSYEQRLVSMSEILREQTEILEYAHVLIRDLDNHILYWNHGMENLYGWTKEEAMGKITHSFFRTVFPQSLEDYQKKIMTDGVWEGELMHTTKTGKKIVVASHHTLYFDAAGKPYLILEVNNDVTELKKTAEQLLESETELKLKNEEYEALNEELRQTNEELFNAKEKTEQSRQELQLKNEEYAAINEEYAAINEELRQTNEELFQTKEKVEKAYANLQDLNSELRKAQKIAKLGSWKWHIKENTLEWSDEMFQIFEVDKKMFNGKLSDILVSRIHPEDLKKVEDSNNSVIQKGIPVPVEYRLLLPGGNVKTVWTEAGELIRDKEGNSFLLTGVVQDITERKKAEELILERENQFRTLFENAPEAMFIQVNGRFTYVNKATLKIYGADSPDDLLKMKVLDRIHPDYKELVLERIKTLNSDKIKVKNIEYLHLKLDGTPVDVEVSAVPVRYDGEDGALVFLQDITERKKAQQELILAKEKAEESDRLKSIFLANMSHEVRTPLNGILGFTDLLKDSSLKELSRLRYIDVIEKSGKRLLTIINDLIDLSIIESGQMQLKIATVDIVNIMQELAVFFKPEAQQKNIQLTWILIPGIEQFRIDTDKDKLYLILSNLIKNSLKYSQKGEIRFGFYPAGDKVRFFVRDTGIGIPQDKYELIFQRFRQVEENDFHEGVGLGLNIVKGLVDLMGGHLGLVSKVNKGSLFCFTLPFVLSADAAPVRKEAVSYVNFNNISILAAEDDYYSKLLLEELFLDTRADVEYVENGVELMEMLEKKIPDMILLDINMPLKNGFECLKEIRESKIKTKIIVVSAYAMQPEIQNFFSLGAHGYISKPYVKEDFFKEIKRVMKSGDRS